MYPKSIQDLIESFKMLPGIGEKTAERFAFSVLNFEDEQVDYLSESLRAAKLNVHKCEICNSYTDKEICNVCSDKNRKQNVLCVLEDPKNIFVFEKTESYKGKYHIIEGLISPSEGVNPEDIGIEKLLLRIKKEKFDEIIVAVKQSIEGEITSLYIKKVLEGLNIKISRIASGIPVGADIEYIDSVTLEQALTNRKSIE